MAGAPLPTVRRPVVAGTFYPAEPGECRRQAAALLQGQEVVTGADAENPSPVWKGGIVAHAGWVCSGAIAARALTALALAQPAPDLVVVFGAIHTPAEVDFAALDPHEAWSVPGTETRVAADVAQKLAASPRLFAFEERLHRNEHAVEVELPLISEAWPGARLLPIEVPAVEGAVEIGRRTAERVASEGLRAVYLASSDLTHYGPSYRFTPAGVGAAGLEWAKANDRRMLERAIDLAAELIVPEAKVHANACGAGAIAAMLAACRDGGATAGRVLWHANSYETSARTVPQPPSNAVGYAAVVVG